MGKRFKSKGMGFICISPDGKFCFLNKDTQKIKYAEINRGEYLPKRIARLKEHSPLDHVVREKLTATIRKERLLLSRKT